MQKVFGVVLAGVLGSLVASADGAPGRVEKPTYFNDVTAAYGTNPINGFTRINVGGWATLPPVPTTGVPAVMPIWWIQFTVEDEDGLDISAYGLELWVDATNVSTWPAQGGMLPWSMMLSVRPTEGGQLVDWPSGYWVIVCDLYCDNVWRATDWRGVMVD